MDNLRKQPVTLLSTVVLVGLVLGLWVARAPTSYSGKFLFIGE